MPNLTPLLPPHPPNSSARSMFFSAVLQAVKKGPNARGGLQWKSHAFWKVSRTRKVNALKKLRYVNANDAVLKEAAALEKSAPAPVATTKVISPLWPLRLRAKILREDAAKALKLAGPATQNPKPKTQNKKH